MLKFEVITSKNINILSRNLMYTFCMLNFYQYTKKQNFILDTVKMIFHLKFVIPNDVSERNNFTQNILTIYRIKFWFLVYWSNKACKNIYNFYSNYQCTNLYFVGVLNISLPYYVRGQMFRHQRWHHQVERT